MQDGRMIPDTGFPRVNVMANEERAKTNGHGANTSISYNTHSYTGGQLGVIPSKRASGTVLVRCKVEEVDVLATAVVEVVVLARSRVDGRGSRDLGDGSGTCLSLHEFS